MSTTDLPEQDVYVRYKEVRLTSGSRHTLKFFLVDSRGVDHLAAIGEDLGDAHYQYSNTAEFESYGGVECHNRKELILWLEMIIKESQTRASEEMMEEIKHVGEPTADNPEGLYFLGHRQVRDELPDGRRCNKWYLQDQYGGEHLAVVGEEKDTKDGHYTYRAEEPFASKCPLFCSNQSGVYHWLEQMLCHHPPGGAEGGQGFVLTDRQTPLNRVSGGLEASAGRTRGRGGNPSWSKRRHNSLFDGPPNKRLRGSMEEDHGANQELGEKEKYFNKLRHQAQLEAKRREAVRNLSLTWVSSPPTEEEVRFTSYWKGTLKEMMEDIEPAAPSGPSGHVQYKDPYYQRHGVRIILECLKELRSMYLPLSLMTESQVVPTVQQYLTYPNQLVAQLAQEVMEHWKTVLVHHMKVLDDPHYKEDPLAILEAKILAGEISPPSGDETLPEGQGEQPVEGVQVEGSHQETTRGGGRKGMTLRTALHASSPGTTQGDEAQSPSSKATMDSSGDDVDLETLRPDNADKAR